MARQSRDLPPQIKRQPPDLGCINLGAVPIRRFLGEPNQGRLRTENAVVQLRAEEAKRVAAEERRRSRSRKSRSEQRSAAESDVSPVPLTAKEPPGSTSVVGEMDGDPTLSRANTITPLTSQRAGPVQDHHLHAGLPYASMLGVVLIGMGLMAYINCWQSPPSRLER